MDCLSTGSNNAHLYVIHDCYISSYSCIKVARQILKTSKLLRSCNEQKKIEREIERKREREKEKGDVPAYT